MKRILSENARRTSIAGRNRIVRRRASTGALMSAVVLTTSILCVPAAAQAPSVDWRRSDWFPSFPPLSSIAQSQNASGEDWWYHHANSYNGSNELQGYIAAGYSSFRNYVPIE